MNFFKIPAARINPHHTTVWNWPDINPDFYGPEALFTEEAFEPFDPENYKEMSELPAATKSHFSREAAEDPQRRPRWFFFRVPHVLTTDPVDISDLEIINWKDPIAFTR